jgi:SAM-dependent methyltransferase
VERPWLNVGCGTTAPEGWVNIDRSPGLVLARHPTLRTVAVCLGVLRGPQAEARWPPNVRRIDARKGLPFADGSVGVVYSSHMLEHLVRADAIRFIRECRRVLRGDGLLRLALPDLHRMAEEYVASANPEAADEFVEATGLGWDARPTGAGRLVEAVGGARHRWMYDARSLQHLCLDVGFNNVRERAFRAGRCPELVLVEHREESFFVEASASSLD